MVSFRTFWAGSSSALHGLRGRLDFSTAGSQSTALSLALSKLHGNVLLGLSFSRGLAAAFEFHPMEAQTGKRKGLFGIGNSEMAGLPSAELLGLLVLPKDLVL